MTSLLDPLARSVAQHPERVAIVEPSGHAVSFGELDRLRVTLARTWRCKGIGAGDRVLMAMPLSAKLYASLAALWTLNATAVFPEPAMGLTGLHHAVRVSKPKALCVSGAYRALQFLPSLWGCEVLRPDKPSRNTPKFTQDAAASTDIALISFTSGSSGAPKGIARSHGFMSAQLSALSPLLTAPNPQRDLVAFPVVALVNLALGHTSVLPNWKLSAPDRVAPSALQNLLDTQNVTRALLPPVLNETLSRCPSLPSTLRTVFSGGGPVFPHVVEQLKSKHGLSVRCIYGSTEAEPIAVLDGAEITAEDHRAMSRGAGLLAGRVVADAKVKLVDDEIWVAGNHVNEGYLDPAQDAALKVREDGLLWHRTGDLGRFDAQNRLWLLGRLGSEIRRAGETIYPFCIETAARQWPGVEACALVSHHRGAVLVVQQGEGAQLTDWKARCAAFGVIDVIHMRKIPMDRRHRSKVDYNALTTRLGRDLPGAGHHS